MPDLGKRNNIEVSFDNITNVHCASAKSKLKTLTNYGLVFAYFEVKYNLRHGCFKSISFPKIKENDSGHLDFRVLFYKAS